MIADVRQLLIDARAAEGRPLDWEYINKWCEEWDVADRAARARAK